MIECPNCGYTKHKTSFNETDGYHFICMNCKIGFEPFNPFEPEKELMIENFVLDEEDVGR